MVSSLVSASTDKGCSRGVDPLKRDLDRIILAVDTEVTGVYHRSDKKWAEGKD